MNSEQRSESCTTCSGPAYPWGVKDAWKIVKCRVCGCGFVYPRPDVSFLQDYYVRRDHTFEHTQRTQRYREHMPPEREAALVGKDLVALGVYEGRVLDVGAGFGRFADYFKAKGFVVTALEPDGKCADHIERRGAVRVIRDTFEHWQPAGDDVGGYDVVIMSQVLEHVLLPSAWLKKAWGLVRPGGVVVVGTPNFDSILVRVLKTKEGHICPPEHINFLTIESLRRLGLSNGYELARTRCHSVITRRLCVAGVRERLNLSHVIMAEVLGTLTWSVLAVADHARMGRYIYAYYRKTT